MAALKAIFKLTDTGLFKDLARLLADLIRDNRIDKEIRKEYVDKIDEITSKY
jgi:uncharacterized protein (UPF0147 family)